MEELRCPACDIALLETRGSGSVVWTCPSCKGRCVGYSLLRKSADRAWATEVWQHVSRERDANGRRCPSCAAAMFSSGATELSLELCRSCHLVWFDAGEYERAPLIPARGTRTLPQEALESIARSQAAVIALEYQQRFGRQMSVDEALPLVPGIAGLPLEQDAHGLTRWPWLTWATAVFLTVLGLWSLARPEAAETFGLVATQIDRLGGATFLTALVVHVSLFQLFTNVYFLLVFGDNVEDLLGPATFGLLLLTGGVAGTALHALFDADNGAILMGASGAISAVASFYAVKFPNARLRFVRLARWHTMPASAGLLFWFLSKLASTHALFGRAEPSAWPYVGGALVGLVFWWVMRDPA